MPALNDFKQILIDKLGFSEHHIHDANGEGVKPEEADNISKKAEFLVTTEVGNCYAAFVHNKATLSESQANRYKALSILMPGGPAAYCVVQVGNVLRTFVVEKGNEIHDPPDTIRDAEDMISELKENKKTVGRLKQWAQKTLNIESSLSRFVQILKGCWQDIWDIENQRNDWIFDEFSRFLFIKYNEDSKPNGQFTSAALESFCQENAHRGAQAAKDFMNNLFEKLKGRYSDVFTDENEKVLSCKETIRRVVKRLEGINLRDTEGDVLGRAFEVMLADTFKGRDLGQFFTPREIVWFMLEMARDDEDEAVLSLDKEERFLDACAGSGGFLIAVYEDIYRHLMSKNGDPEKRKRLLHRLARETIYACEIEEKAARLGKLNLIIHAINPDSAKYLPQNYHLDKDFGGLHHEIAWKIEAEDGPQEKRIGPGMFDLVLTNPPFGKAVKRKETLLEYEFGHEVKTFKTKPPEKRAKNSQDSEILFIEHYLRILKPGGKLLIVLPDGVLSNASAKPVRDYMRQHAIIKTVVSLPSGTFASTGASIPTNIVYLKKKLPGEEQGDIFMARADAVGRRANGDPDPNNDLPFILQKFRDWQSGELQEIGAVEQ